MNFNKVIILSSLVLLFRSYFLGFFFNKLVIITLNIFCLREILSFSQLWYIVIRQYILHVCRRPLLNAHPNSSISDTQKEEVVVVIVVEVGHNHAPRAYLFMLYWISLKSCHRV